MDTFPWHRTNFRPADKLEQTLSVQYFRFVHTKLENYRSSKFRTVHIGWLRVKGTRTNFQPVENSAGANVTCFNL